MAGGHAGGWEPLYPTQEALPQFLPGRLCLREGGSRDYAQLACFHYRAARPATWAAVVAVTYEPPPLGPGEGPVGPPARVAGVGVLSWPTAVSRPRREVFGLEGQPYGVQLRFANRWLRTISRVIVHPQFRGLGLARAIVEALCARCPTRFVEATAAMGAAHPMFERAGLRAHRQIRGSGQNSGSIYFWRDRGAGEPLPSPFDEPRPGRAIRHLRK